MLICMIFCYFLTFLNRNAILVCIDWIVKSIKSNILRGKKPCNTDTTHTYPNMRTQIKCTTVFCLKGSFKSQQYNLYPQYIYFPRMHYKVEISNGYAEEFKPFQY